MKKKTAKLNVYSYKNINYLARHRDNLLKRLNSSDPFIRGSVVKIARACGNSNCKCAGGEKHVSDYLTYRHKDKKKTSTIYIPVGMVEEVKIWVREYKRLQERMEEICQIQRQIIKQYVKEKKRPKKQL
jgi:hypothetical protein